MYGMREPSEIEIVVYFVRLRHDAIILMKGVLWPRDTWLDGRLGRDMWDDYIELSFMAFSQLMYERF